MGVPVPTISVTYPLASCTKLVSAMLASVTPPGFSNETLVYRINSAPEREQPFTQGVGGGVAMRKRIRMTCPPAARVAGRLAGTLALTNPESGFLPGTYSAPRSQTNALPGSVPKQSFGR